MFNNVYGLTISKGTKAIKDQTAFIIRCFTQKDPEEMSTKDTTTMVFRATLFQYERIKRRLVKYAKTHEGTEVKFDLGSF